MGITRFFETLFHSCLMCILSFLCQVPLSTATEDLANITRAGKFVDGDISHVLLAQQPFFDCISSTQSIRESMGTREFNCLFPFFSSPSLALLFFQHLCNHGYFCPFTHARSLT